MGLPAIRWPEWLPRIGGTLLGNLAMLTGKTVSWTVDGVTVSITDNQTVGGLQLEYDGVKCVLVPGNGSLGILAADGGQGSIGASYFVIGSTVDKAGSGSPEGVVTAGVGSTYRRVDGGAGSALYVKETGSGATGWQAK